MWTSFCAVVGGVIGWFAKAISDYMSEKRLYDNRIRLEKEYGLYSDLWDKLFELRRAIGQAIEPISGGNVVRHDKCALDLFNAFHLAVWRGEPFMSASVFEPARKIVTTARRIINNIGTQMTLDEDCEKAPNRDFVERRMDDAGNSIRITPPRLRKSKSCAKVL